MYFIKHVHIFKLDVWSFICIKSSIFLLMCLTHFKILIALRKKIKSFFIFSNFREWWKMRWHYSRHHIFYLTQGGLGCPNLPTLNPSTFNQVCMSQQSACPFIIRRLLLEKGTTIPVPKTKHAPSEMLNARCYFYWGLLFFCGRKEKTPG